MLAIYLFFFFFNDTATTEIYTLSLHDALPIFPAFVSATVAASEAVTELPPQPLAVDFVFGGTSRCGCALAVVGRMTELAKPAPKVAMPPMKRRRPSEAGADSGFGFF